MPGIAFPVPGPVCRRLVSGEWLQDRRGEEFRAGAQPLPTRIEGVHGDEGSAPGRGDGLAQGGLSRTTGAIDRNDNRCAAAWFGGEHQSEDSRHVGRITRPLGVRHLGLHASQRKRATYRGRVSVATRVIACLDVDGGRVVKGINFENLRDAGDPVELAARYDEQGIDELTFLDVTASSHDRATTYDLVTRTAEQIFIPLTVGGGVRTVDDVDRLLRAGADKVGINTAAIARPEVIADIADRFGAQVLVLSADVKRHDGHFVVTTHGGRRLTDLDALEWCSRAAELGAGEILLNSMDADGTKAGFDVELIRAARHEVSVPLIASGGAGVAADFPSAARAGADAVLAASVFHFGTLTVGEVKDALREDGFLVR